MAVPAPSAVEMAAQAAAAEAAARLAVAEHKDIQAAIDSAVRLASVETAVIHLTNHLTHAVDEIRKDIREIRAWLWGSMGILGAGLGATVWGIWGK